MYFLSLDWLRLGEVCFSFMFSLLVSCCLVCLFVCVCVCRGFFFLHDVLLITACSAAKVRGNQLDDLNIYLYMVVSLIRNRLVGLVVKAPAS